MGKAGRGNGDHDMSPRTSHQPTITIAITITITVHPPLSNKKASNKKLDSQRSYFSRRTRDLIRRSKENSLLRDKKSRLSLEKSYFLLDRGECNE